MAEQTTMIPAQQYLQRWLRKRHVCPRPLWHGLDAVRKRISTGHKETWEREWTVVCSFTFSQRRRAKLALLIVKVRKQSNFFNDGYIITRNYINNNIFEGMILWWIRIPLLDTPNGLSTMGVPDELYLRYWSNIDTTAIGINVAIISLSFKKKENDDNFRLRIHQSKGLYLEMGGRTSMGTFCLKIFLSPFTCAMMAFYVIVTLTLFLLTWRLSIYFQFLYSNILLCLFTHFAGARREIVIRPKSNALDYLGAYFHRLCLFRL